MGCIGGLVDERLRSVVNLLPYQTLSTLSMSATPLKSLLPVRKQQVSIQILHLPFHFTTQVLTSEQITSSEHASAAVYKNHLTKPRRIPIRRIDTPLLPNLCQGISEHVLSVPSIHQPSGHSCGMACNLNALMALELGSLNAILNDGITSVLNKYRLPVTASWTNGDFVSATKILIRYFIRGLAEVPANRSC